MNNKEFVVYFLLILLILFILGQCSKVMEGLEMPSSSSTSDINSGSSALYGWGYKIKKEKNKKKRNCPNCKVDYNDYEDTCETCLRIPKICRYADIRKNVNIDKYVLKSTVPPCPDMSEYIKKSEVPPCIGVDTTKWILKSEIPPCKGYNRPKCLECPKCPVCPTKDLKPVLSNTNTGFE
jgi:hypothetical protein